MVASLQPHQLRAPYFVLELAPLKDFRKRLRKDNDRLQTSVMAMNRRSAARWLPKADMRLKAGGRQVLTQIGQSQG